MIWSIIEHLVKIIGGLGIFLFGMKMMSEGLHKSAGEKMQTILNIMTGNRFSAVLTGLGTTALIQSSSATTVMTVSLVNAGLLSLKQSLGVIMGANIGTTLTAWMITLIGFKLKIADFALPAIVLSLPLHFSKNEKARDISEIFMGFGLLFLGLYFMKEGVPAANIKDNMEMLAFVKNFTGHGYLSILLFVVLGTVLTIVVQSSSAAMSITLTMAFKGWINFDIAAAIVLGENIGTTITAFLASLEMSTNAKRAARGHMVFNLLGVFWMLIFFYPFLRLIDYIFPGLSSAAKNLPMHLSGFHSAFNILNTCLFIGFIPFLVTIIKKLVPDKGDRPDGPYKIPFIHTYLSDKAEVNLISANSEVGKMANRVLAMYVELIHGFTKTGKNLRKLELELSSEEDYLDNMLEELTSFYSECASLSLSEKQAANVSAYMRIINELEEISDACYKIVVLLGRRDKKKRKFHDPEMEKLTLYGEMVLNFLRYDCNFLSQKIKQHDMEQAAKMEKEINKNRDSLNKASRSALKKGADIKGELLYMDVVRQLEHIGDFSLIISNEIERLNS